MQAACEAAGFEQMGRCDASALRVLPEVREMCASGKCQMYGKSWACPPHCGELDDFQTAIDARAECLVVQTVRDLEDEFDVEAMMEAQRIHDGRMKELAELLASWDGAMILSAGTCSLCAACTCPDEPCRFPEKRLVSMESAGLMVNDACIAAGIPYNHGKNTIAYTGCVII